MKYANPEVVETCFASMVLNARSDLEGKDSLLALLSKNHETVPKFSDLVNHGKCNRIPYLDLV